MMNRRTFSAALLTGAAASLISTRGNEKIEDRGRDKWHKTLTTLERKQT